MSDWDWSKYRSDEEYRTALRAGRTPSEQWLQHIKDRQAGYRSQAQQQREKAVDAYTAASAQNGAQMTRKQALDAYEQSQLRKMVSLRDQGVSSDQIGRYLDVDATATLLSKYRRTATPNTNDLLFLKTTNFSKDPQMGVYAYDASDPEDQVYQRMGLPAKAYLSKYRTDSALDQMMAQAGVKGLILNPNDPSTRMVVQSDQERLRSGIAPNSVLQETANLNRYKQWYLDQVAQRGPDVEKDPFFLGARALLFPEYARAYDAKLSKDASPETNPKESGGDEIVIGSFSGQYTPGQTEAKWIAEYNQRGQQRRDSQQTAQRAPQKPTEPSGEPAHSPQQQAYTTQEQMLRDGQTGKTFSLAEAVGLQRNADRSADPDALGGYTNRYIYDIDFQNHIDSWVPNSQMQAIAQAKLSEATPSDAFAQSEAESFDPVQRYFRSHWDIHGHRVAPPPKTGNAYGYDIHILNQDRLLYNQSRGQLGERDAKDINTRITADQLDKMILEAGGDYEKLSPIAKEAIQQEYMFAEDDIVDKPDGDKINSSFMKMGRAIETGPYRATIQAGQSLVGIGDFFVSVFSEGNVRSAMGLSPAGQGAEQAKQSIQEAMDWLERQDAYWRDEVAPTEYRYLSDLSAQLTTVIAQRLIAKGIALKIGTTTPVKDTLTMLTNSDIADMKSAIPALIKASGQSLALTAPYSIPAFGDGYRRARDDGASSQEATAYAFTKAAQEIISEKMPMDFFQKSANEIGVKQLQKSVTQKGFQRLVTRFGAYAPVVLAGGVVEGSQEMISEVTDWLARKIIYDPDAQLDPGQLMISGASGALFGMVLAGLGFRADTKTNEQAWNMVEQIRQGQAVEPEALASFVQTMERELKTGNSIDNKDLQQSIDYIKDTDARQRHNRVLMNTRMPVSDAELELWRVETVRKAGELNQTIANYAKLKAEDPALPDLSTFVDELTDTQSLLRELDTHLLQLSRPNQQDVRDTLDRVELTSKKINVARRITELEKTRDIALQVGSSEYMKGYFVELEAIDNRLRANPDMYWGDRLELMTQRNQLVRQIRLYNDMTLPNAADAWVADAFLQREELTQGLQESVDPLTRARYSRAILNIDQSIDAVYQVATDKNYLIDLQQQIFDLKRQHAELSATKLQPVRKKKVQIDPYTNLMEAVDPYANISLDDAYCEFILQSADSQHTQERQAILDFTQEMAFARMDIFQTGTQLQALGEQCNRMLAELKQKPLSNVAFNQLYETKIRYKRSLDEFEDLKQLYSRRIMAEAIRRGNALKLLG